MPANVNLRAMSSTDKPSKSMKSFNHERGIFIFVSNLLTTKGTKCHKDSILFTSCPFVTLCGKSVLELLQESHIVTPEVTDIVNFVAQHQLAFRSHAPGITRIDLWVVAAVLQNNRMHHAAAHDLQ